MDPAINPPCPKCTKGKLSIELYRPEQGDPKSFYCCKRCGAQYPIDAPEVREAVLKSIHEKQPTPEAASVVPDKYRLKLNERQLKAGFLDVYDILELTGVEDKELDHAAKKILCSGRRGKGDKAQDVGEAIVALQRYLERHP